MEILIFDVGKHDWMYVICSLAWKEGKALETGQRHLLSQSTEKKEIKKEELVC